MTREQVPVREQALGPGVCIQHLVRVSLPRGGVRHSQLSETRVPGQAPELKFDAGPFEPVFVPIVRDGL